MRGPVGGVAVPGETVDSHTGRLYGLTVTTPFPLGRHDVGPGSTAAPDVVVAVDPGRYDQGPEFAQSGDRLLATYPPDDPYFQLVERGAGHAYRLRSVVDVDISPGQRLLTCRLAKGGPAHFLPVYVGGHVLATVLLLRGELVLHASAVELGGIAAAFVGHSGGGKSTLAALACQAGARLVTDDVLRVDPGPEGGEAVCHTGGDRLRLRTEAAGLLARPTPAGCEQSPDGRYLLETSLATADRLPLKTVLIPRLGPASSRVALSPIKPADALLAMLSFPRVPGWVDPTTTASQFRKLATLVAQVEAFYLDVPKAATGSDPRQWADDFHRALDTALAGGRRLAD